MIQNPWVNMFFHSNILSWFWDNQSLLLLLNGWHIFSFLYIIIHCCGIFPHSCILSSTVVAYFLIPVYNYPLLLHISSLLYIIIHCCGIFPHPKLYMNPTKNLIDPKLYTIPTKNLIELKPYMNPNKNLI